MSSSIRILIVDDCEEQRLGYVRWLEAGGYVHIEQAANGLEAVLSVNQYRPDVVVLDLVMDLMDGISAIKYIKAVDPSVAIVVHSASGGVADLQPDSKHVHSIITKEGDIEQQGQNLVVVMDDIATRHWRNAERSRLDSAFAGAVDKFTREFKSLVEDFTVDVHKRVRHQLESGQDIEELGARLLSSLHKEGSELSLGQHSNDGVSARELSPVVDRGYFKEFMDSVGGPEIVTPILSEFAQRSANCVTAFKDYLDGAFEDAGDEPARLAHELAGMCASVAAVRAREDATFLLKAVKDSAERDTLREHVARLVDSLDEAYETLDSLAAEA